MPFIGNQPADKFLTLEKQVFTTSATDTYTLDREVSSVNDLELFLNNVRQEPTEAYTISGTTLTLASAITSSDSLYCVYQGRAVGTTKPADNTVTGSMMSYPLTNFSSTGIDDNADATAITIDSSERVLKGHTGSITTGSRDSAIQLTGTSASDSSLSMMRFNSSGGPAELIMGQSRNSTIGGNTIVQNADNVGVIQFVADDGTDYASKVAEIRCDIDATPGANDTPGRLRFSTTADGSNSPTERMRIASNGKPFFSTTGTNSELNSTWKFQMRFDGGSDAGLFMASEANGNGTGFIRFNRSSTTSIGQIVRNGTNDSVNYSTTSDYRMKENVIDLSDATTRVKQLQPKRFSWISQESDTPTVDGFLAHEVSDIVPEAITGTHNEVDEEGNPVYQGIDQSKLVPLLTASLKEAIAKIEELETRIETLENA